MAIYAAYNLVCSLPPPPSPLLPYQTELQPFVTTVIGNLAYERFRRQLESIDDILLHYGIEERFLRVALDQDLAKRRAEGEQTGKLRALCPGDQILFQNGCPNWLKAGKWAFENKTLWQGRLLRRS